MRRAVLSGVRCIAHARKVQIDMPQLGVQVSYRVYMH